MAEKRKTYTAEFKREAIRLVTEHHYSVAEAARNLGINTNKWCFPMARPHTYTRMR